MNQYIITEDMVLWVEARYGGGNKIGVLRSILYNPQEICPYLKDEWDNADDVNANQNPCCPTIVTGLSKRYHCTYNPQAERDELLEDVRRIALNVLPLSYYYVLRDKLEELRKGGE